MICLDSDFIIDLLHKKQNAVLKLESLKNEVVVSTEINYFELVYGVFANEQFSQKDLALIEEFFDSIPLVGLEHSGAFNAAKISATLKKEGKTIQLNDELIAGICSSKGCSILTRNVEHFSRIKGLKVERY